MTVPTSISISSLPNNLVSTNQLSANSSTLQLPTSCVSLVSSSNANISIPISIRTSLANSQQPTTMSWAQGAPIQFATQRPNGTISLIPQQIYQMPNETILQMPGAAPQTMLITQQPPRPPGQNNSSQNNTQTQFAGQAAGSIVQIIQTPNGPAQLLSTSGLKQAIAVTNNTNLISSSSNVTSSVSNTITNSVSNTISNGKSNKQILPKVSKNYTSTLNTSTIITSSINSITSNKISNSSTASNKTLLTTNLSTPMNQQLTTPHYMFNTGQPSFITSNGILLNQIPLSAMGQQQFIIPNQLTNPNSQGQNKNQQNQAIIIPSSPNNAGQLKGQNIILAKAPDMQPVLQQNTTPQFYQIPNGPMLVALQPQASADTILQSLQPNTQTLQLIQQSNTPDGQTVSYSGNNFIFTSQPSLVNSTISNFLTTSTSTLTTNTSSKTKTSRKKQPAKKDNKNNKNQLDLSSNNVQKTASKGLNLAELLKETGIIESSPPTSPQLISQTSDFIEQNNLSNNTSQLTTLDFNEQQPATAIIGNTTTNLQSQPTVVMVPSNNAGGANYFLNPTNQLTNASNTAAPNTSNQPQLKLAVAPDGSLILQTVPTFAQPSPLTQSSTVQSSLTSKFVDTSKDNCGPGSSQPSPDSTTPTLDGTATPTSCSSLSIPTSTITFTTNNNMNTNNNSNNQLSASSIKLTESISLTIQNSGKNTIDESYKLQNTTITPVSAKKTKAKDKKETTRKNKKQTAKSQIQQQLITIPIQTNLNSSMNSVITNPSNTAVIQLRDNNIMNNVSNPAEISIKKSESGILVLNSNTQPSGTQQAPTMTTHLDQSGIPVVQISLNNQEFLERLETQVKSLSGLKNPTQEQQTLLQELLSLQKKMLQAKSNAVDANGNEGNIILTSQPLLSQQADLAANKNQTIITPINKITKDSNLMSSQNVVNNANTLTNLGASKTTNVLANNQTNNGTQIITITSKPLESNQGKKISISSNTSVLDQSKNSSTVLQSQPAQIIFQQAPNTTIKTINDQNTSVNNTPLQIINQDSQQTNTFDGQKFKILTTSSNLANQSAQPGTTTFQLGNQFITITSAGKGIAGNQLTTTGQPTQTVYQVVHLQAAQTNTINNIELINNNGPKIIKLTDNQLQSELDKNKPKSQKYSFQQQLSADQAAAAKPDTKTPFKNYNDACKRLLRYHVFYQPDLKEEKLTKFDDDFELLSQYLVCKKEQLFRRFQYNLLKLTMKSNSTAENIMLDKCFVDSETVCLKEDKESVAKGNILSLPEPPIEWKDKIKASIEEELNKLNQSKKRKSEEESLNDESFMKIKKLDLAVFDESEDEDEDSEGSVDEDNNDMHDFNKYLDNINEMNPIDDLSSLYSNSNTFNPLLQATSNHQSTNDNIQTNHHSDTFQLFDQDWAVNSSDPSNEIQSKTTWAPEDEVAVESILDGPNPLGLSNLQPNQHQNALPSEFGLPNLQGNLVGEEEDYDDEDEDDDEDDDDDEDEDDDEDLNSNNQLNPSSLLFDQKNSQINNLNSNNDPQMESAINSILDILVPPNSNVNVNSENGLTDHNVPINTNTMQPNGFNFNNSLTPNNQVNFSQNNFLNTSMPGMMSNRPNLISDYGQDSVLDEAVKSILS